MGDDILQDIPVEELPQLRDLCKERLGEENNIYIVNLLKNAINWFKNYPDNSYIRIMAPNGDWKSDCTFIADITMPSSNCIVMLSLEKSNERLMNAVLKTNRINWNREILFAMIPSFNAIVVERLLEEKNIPTLDSNETVIFNISKEEALKFDCSCSPDIYIAPLKLTDSVQMNEVWPHKFENSEQYIAAMIARNASLGVYHTDTGELLAWAMVNFVGAIANLQTADAHKRKGYGALLTRALAKEIAQRDNWDSFGTVVVGNVASVKMFNGLGFRKQGNTAKWYDFVATKS